MSEKGANGRREGPSTAPFRFGPFEFDPAAGLVYRGDEETLLPPKAARVLQVLLENAGQLVGKDELLETVWEAAYVTESSLTDAISLLRRVLGDDTRDPTYIQTLHRRGYRFIGTVDTRVAKAGVGDAHLAGGGLDVGTKLGNYEIVDILGAGSMGTVYRARDTSLDREVAIKALPADFASDPERVVRLEREAKLLASVSHPNIAAIHSLEQAEGVKFPVLELVEGKTLEERLRTGGFGSEEALEIARQLALALEAAHEQGIIHRDLKPANIMLTPAGQVKVLDFGLAEGLEVTEFDGDVAESPTASLTIKGTSRGSIVGTAAYMSPEQARGQEVDKRADIWSYGCVLYELLGGSKAFDRETITDTLVAIIDREPEWDALSESVPASIGALVRRCLRKDPNRRLRDIGDARIEIEDALSGGSADVATLPAGGAVADASSPGGREDAGSSVPLGSGVGDPGRSVARGKRRIRLSHAAAAVVVVAATASLLVWNAARPPTSEPRLLQRLSISIPPARGTLIAPLLSPDGRHLVWGMAGVDGVEIYHRWIDQEGASLIAGVPDTGVTQHRTFFSPDSQWLGYSTGEGIWKIPVSGGTATEIHEAPDARADDYEATWADDEIIFVEGFSLWRVSETGGDPVLLAAPDTQTGIAKYGRPHFLPGGRGVLVEGWGEAGDVATAGVWVVSLDTGEPTLVAEQGTDPMYATTGHVVYARTGGTLWAVPFDQERLEVLGSAVRVEQGVAMPPGNGMAWYTLSPEGQLVFIPAARPGRRQVVWVDRQGNSTSVNEGQRNFQVVRMSPDRSRIAASIRSGDDSSTWLYDEGSGAWDPLADGGVPLWTVDGERILFISGGAIYWTDADFSGEREKLLETSGPTFPVSWAEDGAQLLLHEQIANTQQRRIGMMSMDDRAVDWLPFPEGQFNQQNPMVSPGGRWMAYVSATRETGRNEVYVVSFPDLRDRTRVSPNGGHSPMWGADETELFYIEDQRMMVARLGAEPVEREGLFSVATFHTGVGYRTYYDYDPGTDRFLMVENIDVAAVQLTFVVNWFEELKRLVPTGGR